MERGEGLILFVIWYLMYKVNRRQRKVGARMEYLSIRQTAVKWGISIRKIQVLE